MGAMTSIDFQSDRFYATNASFTATDEVIEFTRPLRSLKISYFTYDRHYADGSRVALTNAPDWIQHYWRREMFKLAVFEKDSDNFTDGYVFWNWLNREPIYSAAAQFGIDNGVTLIERGDGHCDFFHFGSVHDNSVNNDYLAGKMAHLQQFVSLFKYKLYDVIEAACNDRIYLPESARGKLILDSDINHDMLVSDFYSLMDRRDVSRIYLGDADRSAYLTKKEVALMRELVSGASCAEAAVSLDITSDAVNKHIKNIKERLNCRSLCQLGFVIGKLSARNIYPFSVASGANK
ncbi:helix-turn-helix transcriptional regulator [Chromobacterium violaceum]|uniref:helix-turn-helix transcriptional regulator n=1 Tax=Chromobacterium violaceum TaxID=536 RepID=UPI0009B98BFA|nr:LuxR C-terminal-related transcriptional regulator [Chromobacterium violaceum]